AVLNQRAATGDRNRRPEAGTGTGGRNRRPESGAGGGAPLSLVRRWRMAIDIEALRARLTHGDPLEDVVHAFLEAAAPDEGVPEELAADVLVEVVNHSDWRDPARAVATLRFALDAAAEHGQGDGDTPTLLLGKMIAIAPDRDDLL